MNNPVSADSPQENCRTTKYARLVRDFMALFRDITDPVHCVTDPVIAEYWLVNNPITFKRYKLLYVISQL